MGAFRKFFATGRYLALRLSLLAIFLSSAGLLLLLSGDLIYSSFSHTLRPWHTHTIANEFKAKDASSQYTFQDYLAQEDKLFAEVDQLKARAFNLELDSRLSRYSPAGSPLVSGFDRDWNRSFVMKAAPERAVALLVHGLSDSPYSMRATALALVNDGVTVYGLRLPGHGSIPAGLDQVRYEDWSAAVSIAVRDIVTSHAGTPFFAVGYSTGAALLLKYSADAVLSGQLEKLPRILFLYSPALGVTPLARFANLQRLVTRFGVLQKARWSNVDLEIDPFKYQSFAKNAAAQLSELLPTLYEALAQIQKRGLSDKLPVIISFQSVVDQTIVAADLLEKLYAIIDNPRSELVMFGLNRTSGLETFLNFSPQALLDVYKNLGSHNFRLSIVKNASLDSLEVVERTTPADSDQFSERDLHLAWPDDIFSLSHVAIPFPPDDPVNGYAALQDGKPRLNLGSLQLRGERGVLMISAADQLRLRSNPFYSYMIGKIVDTINADIAAKPH
ncbi:MAG: alpha/beta fold hydrolase [Deltaproteobacteria bacterium]|nr:alpha/beta fold hydrolase [Deltaproteobacteria bacterium]